MSWKSELPSSPSPIEMVPNAIEDGDVVPILIVDDQTSNLEALEALLATSGCRLVRAHTADEALLALLQQDFAAIILDIMMPGMSGLELAELIKQRSRTHHVPILFLTAHMMDERDVLRGYGTGAVDYLTKPIHSDILRSKIAVFIELFRKSRALLHANALLRREVAGREQVEDKLRQANQDLERRVEERTAALASANRRKDEFLASLAHELRNPLAPIRSAVEILQATGPSGADDRHAREVIVRQVQHMTRLIDDLMDVSRITSDKLVLQIRRVGLAEIVESAIETSGPLIAERNHRLATRLPESQVMLEADPERLGQVLSNLLANAAKYTAPGGHVQLTAEVVDHEVTIRILDDGIGIEQGLLLRVFELFQQGDHSRTLSAGGLGVGLTLARRLVEMHGGRLEAKSEGMGRGSEFSVRLPIAAAFADAASARGDQAPAMPRARRILVVDDNEDAADMLAVMLATWGQETRVAYDGIVALAVGREFEPEVVLLDIGLPNLDGHETARRMRDQAWGRRATLVAVTGWGQEADLVKSREAGFDHHLVKPVNPQLLQALIANHGTSLDAGQRGR